MRLQTILKYVVCLWAVGAAHAEDTTIYSFGVLSQRSALLTAQYWNPILAYVTDKSGIQFSLKLTKTAPETNEAIEQGSYDFVYSNTIFQPRMTKANYKVILRPTEDQIAGQLVVPEMSPIKSIKELQGKKVGFPSLAAFVGYAVPMQQLMTQKTGVVPVFGGNQEGIMGQLKAGLVEAAGVNDKVMQNFSQRENFKYRVLWSSEKYHNIPISVHSRVPAKVWTKVQAILDAMDSDPTGVAILKASAQVIGQEPPFGFKLATANDYANMLTFYATTQVTDYK